MKVNKMFFSGLIISLFACNSVLASLPESDFKEIKAPKLCPLIAEGILKTILDDKNTHGGLITIKDEVYDLAWGRMADKMRKALTEKEIQEGFQIKAILIGENEAGNVKSCLYSLRLKLGTTALEQAQFTLTLNIGQTQLEKESQRVGTYIQKFNPSIEELKQSGR